MSTVHNYVLLSACEDVEMPHPWARVDQFVTSLGPRADPLVLAGKVMEVNVYLRVVSDGTPIESIAKQVRDAPWDDPDGVVLMTKQQDDDGWSIYDHRSETAEVL